MKRVFALCFSLVTTPVAAADLFTDYQQAKPVLDAIKSSWVAVREYDGQDLLYFTNLLTYRCAIAQIRFSYNNGPLTAWDPEPCYWDENPPYAQKMQTHLPYAVAPLGALETITVDLLFEDGSNLSHSYDRRSIKIN